MSDVHSRKVRSYNMSRIKSGNTKPEILLRKLLHAEGIRFRLHDKKLPGKPDLVLKKYQTVIFMHGCFWHGHDKCKYFKLPKTRTDFWKSKIEGNIERDRKVQSELKSIGWNIIVVWECNLKKDKIEESISNILNMLNQNIFL